MYHLTHPCSGDKSFMPLMLTMLLTSFLLYLLVLPSDAFVLQSPDSPTYGFLTTSSRYQCSAVDNYSCGKTTLFANTEGDDHDYESARRSILKGFTSTVASYCAFSGGLGPNQNTIAWASPPMKDSAEADNVGARFERATRPKPSKLLRQQLNRDFAVLLMRSSYNALDQLDCVAMDQFQRDFFFIRQAEYQTYVKAFGPGAVQQGELSDPNYFDFISFAQYATISRDVSGNPPLFFEEQQPVQVGDDEPQQFQNVLIKRNADVKNSDLPSLHSKLVGEAILDKLNSIFDGTPSAIPSVPANSQPSPDVLLSCIRQMSNLFLINGFAWEGIVSISKMGPNVNNSIGTEFQVKFVAPATLWSGQSLQKQNATACNDFFLKAVTVFLDRAGYSIAKSSVKYTKTEELTTFTVI